MRSRFVGIGVFCATLATVAVLAPVALATTTLDVTFPATVQLGQQATINATVDWDPTDCYTTDDLGGPCYLDVYVIPPGGYCTSNEGQVSGESNADEIIRGWVPEDSTTSGEYTDTALPPPFTSAGNWSICSFLVPQDGDPSNGAYQAGAITVTAPPPAACVVPQYRGLTLAHYVKALARSHCTGATIRYVRSRVHKGDVVSISEPVGKHLGHNAAIDIVVSKG